MFENFRENILPGLEIVKTFLMNISTFLANALKMDVTSTYTILILSLSALIGYKLMGLFFTTLEGRWKYWLGTTLVIFLIIKLIGL